MKFKTIINYCRNYMNGFIYITNKDYSKRINYYTNKYENNYKAKYNTNIRFRRDYALRSWCRDQVIEDYLHSNRFRFNKVGVLFNPFENAPQTAILLMYSPKPVSVKIHLESANRNSVYDDLSSVKCYHRISVTGLEQGTNNITLSMLDESGKQIKKDRMIKLQVSKSTQLEENPIVAVEQYEPSAYKHIFITGGNMNPFIFNTNGTIFHSLQLGAYRTSTYGVYPFGDHKFLWPVRNIGAPSFANPHSSMAYEMDYMGRVRKTYHIKNGIHHFVCELPNGNLVTYSSSNEKYTGFIEEGCTEDIIIELDRATGEIVRKIYLKDLLGTDFANMVDWVHGNSLEYNEEEDSMLICMRNVHTVLKFKWSTCEVMWVLSLPEFWKGTQLAKYLLKPINDVHYSYQAHSAYEVKNITDDIGKNYYLIFDNHRLNRRPLDGKQEDGHSYINIYAIDEKNMTVEQYKNMQIDMSIVRSNARYDVAKGRVLNMSGCMTRDNVEYRGKVEEIDFESEKVINRYLILDDFFSGYDFEWHSDDYCVPLSETTQGPYCCGEAEPLVTSNRSFENSDEKLDDICFSKPIIEEDYLLFYTKDHSIDALVLNGTKNNYEVDYSKTWQTTKIHIERSYYCVVSMKGLPKDHYKIKVLKDNRLYDTNYFIGLQEDIYE